MEVASSLAGKVMDLLFGVAKTEISYMWNCSKNVKTFKEEVDKLTAMKETLQGRIDVAKREGQDPGKDLENWMKNANVKISDATKLITEENESKKTCCNLPFCVNLGTLYHYGKMATKKTTSLLQLKEEGEPFRNCVFDPLPTPGFIDLYQTKDLENIDTQKSALKEIIEAVKDLQVVGVVGLGGVGKTTLAKEAAATMKDEFDHIESITVSHDVDAKKIEEKLQVAARRIKNGDKVLIILDDVWEKVEFEKLGIPCGSEHMNCKILLTSRSTDVCALMNTKVIKLNPLTEKEAWNLFKRVVGECEWDRDLKLKEVALKIVKECGGLPLFIQAVGTALKNKEIKIWEATLCRLKDPTDGDIPFKTKQLLQLKLSYDFLEGDIAKSCFLLCSMFPEDETIELQQLTYYGLALEIFNKPDCNIQEARDRVQVAVDSLKSSYLLLPDTYYFEELEFYQMHDLVRDMAMLVTSKGNDKFLVLSGRGLGEWQPKERLKSYNKISLRRNSISNLVGPHEVVFPHLDTFLIQENCLVAISDEFFRGMEKLKLLDMSDNQISSLPQSLKHLTELRMLNLSRNESLCEISILGELTCLEILQLRSTGITIIPEEIGRLANLRLLDVYHCCELSDVTCGVILKLIRLEELYVGLNKGNYDFLLELSKSLKILHLRVPELHHVPEDFCYEHLVEFRIEDDYYDYSTNDCKPVLHISRISFPLTTQVMKLIRLTKALIFWNIGCELNSVLPDLYPEGGDNIKSIEFLNCNHVETLVKINDIDVTKTSNAFSQVEKIELYNLEKLRLLWDTPHQCISLSNLTKMTVDGCHSLLELFPLRVAQTLVNLRDLKVSDCSGLLFVISTRDVQTEIVKQDSDIVFPAILQICLEKLPQLESFYSGHSTIKYPYLKNIKFEDCPSMERWSNGENHIPNVKFEYGSRCYSNINDYIAAPIDVVKENLMINQNRSWDDTHGRLTRMDMIRGLATLIECLDI